MRFLILLTTLLFIPFVAAGGNIWDLYFSDGHTTINGTDVCVNSGSTCLSTAGGGGGGGNTSEEIRNAVNISAYYQLLTNWSNLLGIPAGFADGVDNTAGSGTVFNETDLSLNETASRIGVNVSYIQRRVSGTCAAGNSIREIAIDGTVTCETDSNSDCDGAVCAVTNTGTLDGYNGADLLDNTDTNASTACSGLNVLNGNGDCVTNYNTSTDMINAVNISSFFQILIDWTNLQNIPAGFADGVDDTGGNTSEEMRNAVNTTQFYQFKVDCDNVLFDNGYGPSAICDGVDATGGASGENYWIDNGTFVSLNATYAEDIVFTGDISIGAADPPNSRLFINTTPGVAKPAIRLDNFGQSEALFIYQHGPQNAIQIDSNSTSTDVVKVIGDSTTDGNVHRIDCDGLTTGKCLFVQSSSSDGSARDMIKFSNTHGSAGGTNLLTLQQAAGEEALFIDNDHAGSQAINVDSEAVATNTFDLNCDATTTGRCLRMDVDALTTGYGFFMQSTSSDTSSRNLMMLSNEQGSATGTKVLHLKQDAAHYGLYVDQNGNEAGVYVDAAGTGIGITVDGASTGYSALFNNGNVGIGTLTPAVALDVVGQINATTDVCEEATGYCLTDISGSVNSDTNASTACAGSTTYLDGEGNCDDISSVYFDNENDITCTAISGLSADLCDNSDADTQLTQEQVEDYVGGMESGTETRISVTYDDGSGNMNYVVDDMNDDTPDNDGEVPNDITIDSSGKNHKVDDNDKIYFGTGDDACIYWDGSSLIIDSSC